MVVLAALVALAHPAPIAAGPREKSLFRTQPTEWNPELDSVAATPIGFRPAWTFTGLRAPLAGDPVMGDGFLAAAGSTGEVVLIDPADGRTVWIADLQEALATGPAIEGGLVMVTTRSGRLRALDFTSGSPVWVADLGSMATAPPRIIEGCLLVPTAAPAIVSLDPRSGAIHARVGLPGRVAAAAVPAAADAILGTDHGMVLRLHPRTLEVRWRRYVRLPVIAGLLVLEDRVYVGAGHTIRALRLRDGHPLWTAQAAAQLAARPFASGLYLYAQCYDNDIYVLRATNGHLVARVRLGHRLVADPLSILTHVILAPATEGSLVGLSLPGLRQSGRFELGIPGEWFTTAPVGTTNRVVVGYGRTEGRILGLAVGDETGPGTPGAAGASPPATP